jgi:chromosome segregation ATPase
LPRVYAPVDDPILKEIDADAQGKGISRAQWVCTAIESYLHLDGANPEEMHRELLQLRTEKEQTWRQITQLQRTEEKARNEAQEALGRLSKIQAELDQATKDNAALNAQLGATMAEAGKLRETMKLKEEEVAFLRGHVAQLTQSISQLSLPPSQEEIKAKGSWWKFWK